jgi:hypothetical protein
MLELQKRKLSLTFTDFVYGLVAGSSFQRIDELSLSESNVLLTLCLLILFDDFLLYRADSESLEYTPKRQVFLYWMDLFVLASWYVASLASAKNAALFFLFISLFYFTASLWELFFSKTILWKRLVFDSDLPLCVTSLAIAYLLSRYQFHYLWGVIAFLSALFACRLSDYRTLLKQ